MCRTLLGIFRTFEKTNTMKKLILFILIPFSSFGQYTNIPDPNFDEPMEGMDRSIQKEHLGGWLSQLNEREQKILRLRFGLDGEEPLTLAEIGRQINVSRERVRQLEAKAILKLRVLTSHQQAA